MDSNTSKGRRSQILQRLKENSQLSVSDLHKEFNVSEVTIRKDLNTLSNRKLLIRTRGGAINFPQKETFNETPVNNKQLLHRREKQAIGQLAASLIEEGNTILLDSGTTTLEIAKNLERFKDLTIITNALNIAIELVKYKRFNVILIGGNVREPSLSTVGPIAESNLKLFYCDKLFMGVDSFSIESGISTPNIEEANINQNMLRMSKQVIAVFDSSKINKRSFAFIATISKLNNIVTDSNMSQKMRTQLRSTGLMVHIAEI